MSVETEPKFERIKLLETQFEDRYNRDVEIHRAIIMNEEGLLGHVIIKIKEGEDWYVITEYLKLDQTTDYVLSGEEGKPRKYDAYLPAEVFIADLIGQKKRLEKTSGNIR